MAISLPVRVPADAPLLAIVGPTAVGKTAVAVRTALNLRGEIISADSMAVYRGMNIGTAKPPQELRRQVPFHVLDVVDPAAGFSAATFRRHALAAIAKCRSRGTLPIVCGGTGLYVRALLDDLGLAGVPANAGLRGELHAEVERLGAPVLHERLARVDPVAASRIHPNDAVRIVRALEIWKCTGLTPSEIAERERRSRAPIPAVRIGLSMDRTQLDARIDARVDEMFAAGWAEEVAHLLQEGVPPDAPGMRALGYREVVAYLRGIISQEEAVHMVKRNTRRFARRQMTWFRADPCLHWLDVTHLTPEEAAAAAQQIYMEQYRRTVSA